MPTRSRRPSGTVAIFKLYEFIGEALNQLSSTLVLVSVGMGWAIPIWQVPLDKLGGDGMTPIPPR
jgi:hypothetical protein